MWRSSGSPFSSPAPSESTSLFGSPASFEQPVTFEAPVTSPFEAPATIEIPAIAPQGTGTERPIACFVDRAGRASGGLFVGDYLTDDGTDQALFTKHLASVVNAAGTAS